MFVTESEFSEGSESVVVNFSFEVDRVGGLRHRQETADRRAR